MEIVQIAALAIISVCLILAVKNQKPEITMLLSIASGITILTMCIPKIEEIINGVDEITRMSGINADSIALLLKVVGIVYITEFAYSACKDAGEEAIAAKVQIAGKIIILGIAMPLMLDILKIITGILK